MLIIRIIKFNVRSNLSFLIIIFIYIIESYIGLNLSFLIFRDTSLIFYFILSHRLTNVMQ